MNTNSDVDVTHSKSLYTWVIMERKQKFSIKRQNPHQHNNQNKYSPVVYPASYTIIINASGVYISDTCRGWNTLLNRKFYST